MSDEPSWKTDLREQFEKVLATLDEPPEAFRSPAEPEESVPDIYTFYESLAALRHEVRKANRRTAEALSQFGEGLSEFDTELKNLRRQRQEHKPQTTSGESTRIPSAILLALIEFTDRLDRLDHSFQEKPSSPKKWFNRGSLTTWNTAWEERQTASAALLDKMQALLESAGLKPIPTDGCTFDPSLMTAVARDDGQSNQGEGSVLVVAEEIARGYLYHETVIRLAEVRVRRIAASAS